MEDLAKKLEETNKIYMAVIDDPTVYNTDFDYRPCMAFDVAVRVILEDIESTEPSEFSIEEEIYTDKDKFLEDVKKALKENESVEVNGVYYRILELKIIC